ncbi:hypothetical protein BCR33DRAFT_739479 [Rhizoclosmatium globosum]|uniref:Uncharacterized protein n=1 Tax=Rhizoclosmatium globosum TaxID=329046 RepID=A0A1Y2C4L3_9FUNG|nr:hypothetical protein BCR33DRAFT_739479 [Rhizoclosmatium globosum]|eukprot:ORY41972.1 hypothetical protein BCR33DRAFT_739479 [Rhizoclosmatium globosum]
MPSTRNLNASHHSERILRSTNTTKRSIKHTGGSIVASKEIIRKTKKPRTKSTMRNIPVHTETKYTSENHVSDEDEREAVSTRIRFLRREIERVVPRLPGGIPKDLPTLEAMRNQMDLVASFFDRMGMNVFTALSQIVECVNKFGAEHAPLDMFTRMLLHEYGMSLDCVVYLVHSTVYIRNHAIFGTSMFT